MSLELNCESDLENLYFAVLSEGSAKVFSLFSLCLLQIRLIIGTSFESI